MSCQGARPPRGRPDPPYLAGLDLRGRRVVVVGGGAVAARRVPALLDARADVVLVSPHVTAVLEGLGDAGALTWERRPYREGDLDGAWYALALTDRPDVNELVAGEAERRRVFCVRGDDAGGGTARTPAVVVHGEARVAVLTGDPSRSRELGRQVRDLLENVPAPPLAGGRVRGGAVALVGAGPGAADLLTVRARRLLDEADVVIADRLAPLGVLEGLRDDVLVVDAAKNPHGRAMDQEDINAALVAHAQAGRRVVRLKGGDPYVFGRGHEELEACVRAGVSCTVVPGVSSAFAAPAVAGVPVTHRGVAHEVVVVSGHLPPGHPDSLVDWAALGRLRGTLVLLMTVSTMPSIAEALIAGGRAADTPVAVVERAFSSSERSLFSQLGDVGALIVAEGVRPPAVVTVGEVVSRAHQLRTNQAGAAEDAHERA